MLISKITLSYQPKKVSDKEKIEALEIFDSRVNPETQSNYSS